MAASGETVSKVVVKPRIVIKKPKSSLYMENVLTRKISLNFNMIGSNIKQVLEKKLQDAMEGKCINEGYVKPNSIRIATYSSGVLESENVVFQVTFTCLICNPVEGLNVNVVAKNITKAGIRAVYAKGSEYDSPIDVFIARDHNYDNELFQNIKEGDEFRARVIGTRYELNDSSISVLASVVKPKKKMKRTTIKLSA